MILRNMILILRDDIGTTLTRRGCVLDLYRWSSRSSLGIARMLDRDRLLAWGLRACRIVDSPSI